VSPEEKKSTISTPATSINEDNPNIEKMKSVPGCGLNQVMKSTAELEVEFANGFQTRCSQPGPRSTISMSS
jgi:hypothetical protein